jgi:hypothetical protein
MQRFKDEGGKVDEYTSWFDAFACLLIDIADHPATVIPHRLVRALKSRLPVRAAEQNYAQVSA